MEINSYINSKNTLLFNFSVSITNLNCLIHYNNFRNRHASRKQIDNIVESILFSSSSFVLFLVSLYK